MQAVIAGDIIESQSKRPTGYLRILEKAVVRTAIDKMHAIYRGDSFQLIADKPTSALRHALYIKTSLMLHTGLNVRIAIGLGGITYQADTVGKCSGPCFTRAGALLDGLKERGVTLQTSSGHDLDDYVNLNLRLAMLYMDHWNKNALSVVEMTMARPEATQAEIGKDLGIKQTAVSRRLNRANWSETQMLLALYDKYLKQI